MTKGKDIEKDIDNLVLTIEKINKRKAFEGHKDLIETFYNHMISDGKYKTFRQLLLCKEKGSPVFKAFVWDDTPEMSDFWTDVDIMWAEYNL
jgi:hypothetical protein